MLPPKRKSASLDFLNQSIENKKKTFSSQVVNNQQNNTANVSQEELTSQDMSLGNVSAGTLDMMYKSSTEREREDFFNSQAKKEAEKLAKAKTLDDNGVLAELKNKVGEEKAIEFLDIDEKIKEKRKKSIDFIDDNGVNIFAPIYKLHDYFADDENKWGKTAKEEKEYNDLITYRDNKIMPVMNEVKESFKNRFKEIEEKAKKYRDAKLKDDAQIVYHKDGSVGPKASVPDRLTGYQKNTSEDNYTPYQEEINYNIAKKNYEEVIETLEDYTTGNTGFWSGFGTQSKDLKSLGLYSIAKDIKSIPIIEKQNRIVNEVTKNTDKNGNVKKGYVPSETLTDSEQAVIESIAKKQNIEARDLMHDNRLYRTGKGVATSAVMMEQMIATAPIGGPIETAVGKFVARDAIGLTLNTALQQGGKKLALKMIGGELAGGTASLAVQGLVNPMTYGGYAKDQIGNVEISHDENGKEIYLTSQAIYNKYKKDFNLKNVQIDSQINKLSKNKTEENLAKIEELQGMKDSLADELSLIQPHSKVESALFGYSEYLKEAFAERFVGEALGPLGKLAKSESTMLGRGLTKLSDSKIGKGLSAINDKFVKGRNAMNNLALGKISTQAIAHTGQMNMLDSLPGEVLEEVFTALVPTYGQDYGKQLEQLSDSEFYEDVIAQTLIMNGAMGSVGMGMRANNFRLDKKAIAKIYRNIDAATTDEDLAAHINMNTSGSLYSPLEYDAMITKLRDSGKTEQANKLEKTKFERLAAHAIRTGTITNFQETLYKVLLKPDTEISAETKLNIQLAKKRIDELKQVYDAHSEKQNFGTIFNLAEKKLANKQTIEELDKHIVENKQNAKEEIDAFITREGIKIDYSIDTLLDRQFENEEDQQKYNSFLDRLEKENLLAVENHKNATMLKDTLNSNQSILLKNYNDQVHPLYQKKMEEKKAILQDYNSIVEQIKQEGSENAEFNYQNELQETPALIESVVEKLKQKDITGENKDFINDLKEQKLQELKVKQEQVHKEKIAKSIKDLLAQRQEKIDAGEVVPENEPYITIVDEDAKEEHTSSVAGNLQTMETVFSLDDNSTTINNDPVFIADDFNDMIGNTSSFTPQQSNVAKKIVSEDVTKVKNLLNRNISFREYMSHLDEIVNNKEQLKKLFDGYVEGWKQNGFEADDYNQVYMDLFNPLASLGTNASLMAQMFEQQVPIEEANTFVELEEKVEEIKKEVAQREVTTVGYDEENIPIQKTAVNEIESKRTLTITPKLGFSSIAYVEVIENGILVRKSIGNELNHKFGDLIDFRELLNPDKHPSGSKLGVQIAPESLWSQITVSNSRNAQGTAQTITFDKWLSEKEKQNADFRNTQEFRNKVPVFYTNKEGKALAYVQDTDWYNTFNIGNPFGDSSNPNLPTQEWVNHINEGKLNAQNLRNSINNGLTEVTINKPSDGIFYEIPMTEPKITLQEANPQTVVTVQIGEDLYMGNQIFNAGKLLNKDKSGNEGKFDFNSVGHTWEVRRIGTTLNDKGELVPTYRAYPVGRVVSDEQIETARFAMAAHLALKKDASWTRHLKGTIYEMTYEKAKSIQKDVHTQMGLDIENGNEIVQFIKTFFQDNIAGDNLGQYKKGLFDENVMNNVSQHTNNKLLNNRNVKSIVHITREGVTALNQTYDTYLKNNLLTNIKSFDIDDTGKKPTYVTMIQPIITVDYKEVEKPATKNNDARQEAANVIVEQLKTSVPFSLEKHTEFLNDLGIDPNDFDESNDMIANTDKLANIFNVSGDLSITQEKNVRQFIYHKIGNKVSFGYKNKVSKEAIQNDIKSELNLHLNKIEKQVLSMLSEIKNQNNTNGALNHYVEAYNQTLKNIADIKKNYEGIYNKAFADIQKQTQLTLNEKEENDIEQDDVELSVKDYSKDSIEESGKAKASYRLRRFLSEIPVFDSKGVAQKGYLGIPLYMSFNDVYNELSKVLALGSEVKSDYNTIIAKMKQSNNAFVKSVLAKLESADQQIKNELVYNFVRHTLSSKFAMYEDTKNNGVSLKIYNTNANEATRIIAKNWKNENKSSGLYNKNQSLNVQYAQSLLDDFNKWDRQDYRKVPENDLRKWLSKLGYTFEDTSWNQIYNEGIFNAGKQNSFNVLYSQNAGGLFIPLKNWLEKAITNPADFSFDSKESIFNDLAGVTKALSLIEAKYNPTLITLSFRDSGKNISTLVPTKYVTDMVQNLKRSISEDGNNLVDDLLSLSLSENSIILDMLKNEPTFKSMFEISHTSITAFKEKGEQPYRASITDLSDIDYDMAGITGFQDRKIDKLPKGTKFEGISMRMANMLFPTMSDKTTGMYMTTAIFDFLKDGKIDGMFNLSEEGVVQGIGPTVKTLLFNQLVLPELKRIVKFHTEVKATNIKDYDKGATLFHFLPIMNTLKDSDGLNIVNKLALTGITIDEAIEKYQSTFEDAIEGVIKKEVEHKKDMWSNYLEVNKEGNSYSKMFDNNYFKEEGKNPSTDYDLAVYDFVLNNMITNSEVFKVFAGDIANYSKDKLYKEEGKSVNPFDIKDDKTYVSINKEIGVNLGKRLALLIAPGSKIANSYGEKYNQIFLEDSVDISENSEYLIKNYYGQKGLDEAQSLLDKYKKAAELLNKHEQGILSLNPVRYSAVNKTLSDIRKSLANKFPAIDAYFDIESTDAQEYSTATEHISILHRIGRISDEEFKVITNKLLTEGEKGYLTKEELKLVFQPIKPVHTGTYTNVNQDVNRVVYIKSSAFPLIPQLTAGTKLDALRLKMEELETNTGRFTRASFQTANKVGATIKTVKPFDINSLSTIKDYNADDVNANMLVLNRDNFRIQQDVPFKSDKHQDDKVSMGTQFFKLLFGDGVIDKEGFVIDGKELTGKELYQHFNKAFSDIVDSKKQELFLDLGLDTNGQIKNEQNFVKNLQDLLIKEATSRGYSVKSLAGLKIEKLAAAAGFYYEFKTPLWLSSDSNRYESLLNSIITNKIMKHKMPGNGFVAGSESGFRMKENLEGVDKSRIIYLDSYNGKELQGTHTSTDENGIVFHKAQVFIPSKFKNDKKELIDLFEGFNGKEGKYLTRRENGTLTLKEGMIDPALFNNFSFRTPTSSHKSGSSIEIAGILPPEVGDLMIVPKNFTKQKGLDYDIDKESAYQLNHIMTNDGKIKVLENSDIEDITRSLTNKIEEFNLENTSASAKSNFANELFRSFIAGKGSLLDEESLETLLLPQVDIVEKINRLELQLKRKLAENEFIKSHLAIFNNPNLDIQNKINSVLSIDFAKSQAEQLEKLNEAGYRNKMIAEYMAKDATLSDLKANEMYEADQLNFTMLTNSYQKSKMNLGAIGKVAIGVYANYSTFNALLQQHQGEDIYIQDDLGNPKTIQIGHFISDGKLGAIQHIEPTGLSESKLKEWREKHQRNISEAFDEKINTGTDNEKEQVLGRVGVDEFTINVDANTALRGFGKDENGNSISYLLLSQPIIKELNQRRKESKGVLGEFIKDEELINELVSKYGKDKAQYHTQGKQFVIVDNIDGSYLTGNNLLEGIKSNGKDYNTQLQTLKTYLDLEEEAKRVAKVQKVINTNMLGKSMIESQLKYEGLKKLPDNGIITNAHLLIGDYIEINTSENQNGGYMIGNYYVTPRTPQGQIVINGLHLGNTLYRDFFPYQDKSINDVVKEILKIQGKEENISDNAIIENFEEIVENIKKLIYSRKGNNVFNIDPKAKRYELFIDDENNTSLSTYLKDLSKNDDKQFKKGIKEVSQNALLKSFQYETGLGEDELSLIKYNNTATDNLDEENLYNAIPELVMANKQLPFRNGQPYSTVNLAEDLVAYSFLQGGIQKATEFAKFVPIEMLESMGQFEKDSFVPANKKLQLYNTKQNSSINLFNKVLGIKEDSMSTFTKQYFQHNPSKAPKANFKNVKNKKENSFEYNVEDKKYPTLLSVKDNKRNMPVSVSLFEHVGNGLYQKIDTLGNMGISEYEFGNDNVSSIKNLKKNVTPNIATDDNIANISKKTFKVNENTSVKDLLNQVANTELTPEYAHITEAAKWLLPIIGNDKLVLDYNLDAAGRTTKNSKDVTLNPTHTLNVSDDKAAMTLLHEVIHTVTVKELGNYFDEAGNLKTDAPKHVTNLVVVFNEFRKLLQPEITALIEKKALIDNAKKTGQTLPSNTEYTERELGLIYAGTNIKEFITVALTSPMFQEEMNKIQYKATDKSLWDKLSDAILNLLNTVYPGLINDSVAKESIMASMHFIRMENNFREVESVDNIPNDVYLEMEKTQATPTQYAPLSDKNQVQFTIGDNDFAENDMIENNFRLPEIKNCN
ncbi:putative structural protein [Flavobacterium phage FpV4]|uniref:Structural protein n=2 Tax=Fipvunavirus Fpv4 TaxID=2560476 RepID=A0A1B0WM41_9CAUD|nr:virion structural protein [Flavobacterium phage Fpv3]YP_009594088.1 virion structural protein [Flavobacterium phage FpV4]ALN97145.1 putative structural protein [Flavobacterium phage FpV4]ANB40434.1 structural protein [Flavobacterium phage Fpv3]